jgi:hypothetical protein
MVIIPEREWRELIETLEECGNAVGMSHVHHIGEGGEA